MSRADGTGSLMLYVFRRRFPDVRLGVTALCFFCSICCHFGIIGRWRVWSAV